MEKQSFDPATTLEDLYQEHHECIVNAIHRYGRYSPEDVEEIVQNTFLRAYRGLKGLGELPEKPKNWLLKIAKNACHQFFWKENLGSGRVTIVAEDNELEADVSNQPDSLAEQHELAKELEKCLQDLPAAEERAVRLRYMDGLPFKQIAAEYPGRAPSTVWKDAQRGIEQLRIRLKHVQQ